MYQNDRKVIQIKKFLTTKIAGYKERLSSFENPIMQDLAKNAPHLQMEYTRNKATLEAYEDILLAIDNFIPDEDLIPPGGQDVTKAEGDGKKANGKNKVGKDRNSTTN